MRRNLINVVMGVFVAVVFGLAGCGGGGGGSGIDNSSNPSVAGPLAKYEGTWVQGCDGHNRETTTLTSSNNGNTLTMNLKDEYFANAGCSGAVVATGTYDKPPFVMQLNETITNASVKMLTGGTIAATVDRVTSTGSGAIIKYAGSGVTSSTIVGNTTVSHIVYNNGSTDLTSDNSSGGGQGALLLLNGEMFVLNPVSSSTTSFDVFSRYIH